MFLDKGINIIGDNSMDENLVHNNLDFLKVLEKYTLESKLLICQKYSIGLMTDMYVDMDKAYNENIMPWEIEIFTAYSIIYDNAAATEKLDLKTFANTITLIRNYYDNKLVEAKKSDEYSEKLMMISALQQFSVQGLFIQKLFRYHYFFRFQNKKIDMKKAFFDKMEINYEQLEEFALHFVIRCSKGFYNDILPNELQNFLMNDFCDEKVLRLLSIEKEDYKENFLSLYKDNIIDQYYGLKIQYIYPFILENDSIYVPSPYLVINAVTESMLNRLTLNDSKLRRIIGKEVLESYVYDIVKEVDTVTWISLEFEYFNGKKRLLSSDVIVAENDKVIFYDTKAIVPSLKLRKFDATEIEKIISIYAKGIVQIYNQIKNYLEDLFQLDKPYVKNNIFGIVVVLEDAVVSRERIYDKAYSLILETDNLSEEEKNYICSHIKVLPLNFIESMVLKNISLIPELVFQCDKTDKWYDYTYSNVAVDNGKLIPLYDEYISNIYTKILK